MSFKYPYNIITIFFCSVILSNCGANSWFGDKEAPPLEGKRIAISDIDKDIIPQKEAQKISLNFPAPRSLGSWQYPGGLTTNAPGNLILSPTLKRIWTASAGSSKGKGKIATNPIVYNNMVIAIDSNSKVSAINLLNGKIIWRTSLVPKGESASEGFGGGVAADNAMVFVTSGFGTVTALHALSGKVIWQENLGAPIRSSPMAVNGKVFIVSVINMLTALNQTTGEILWDYRRYEETSGILSNSSPAYSNGKLIVPFSSGEIVSVDEKEGTASWGDTLVKAGGFSMMSRISEIAAKPVISNGKVFAVGNSGRTAAIDLKSGKRIWTKNIGGMLTPAVAGNYMFMIAHGNKLIALTKKKGTVRWVTDLTSLSPKSKNIKWTGPIIANNNIYVLSSNGLLAQISANDGKVLGTQNTTSNVFVKPILVNGILLMLTDKATITAYR